MDRNALMFCDLHIHSKYSRACSKDLNFANLVKWAKIKGLDLLGTGDFTHPKWFEEIKALKEKNGFFYYEDFPFLITGEVALIYTHGQGRRIHVVLLIPSIEVAEKVQAYFDKKGRRDYDGRPIFKISCEQLAKDLKEISDDIEIIPAHIWTPWFGIYGSKSGYNSIKEAFGKEFEKIHAIETGISSDPPMNWKISELKNISILSFSDAHSFWPHRLGREASIFYKVDSYKELIKQIRENSFYGTVEADPAYGKYHWDGHRLCDFSCSYKTTKNLNGICPVCKKPLVIGVENRVEELADVPEDSYGKKKFFYKILPLHEIIAMHTKTDVSAKSVWEIYNKLIAKFKDEFNILIYVPKEDLKDFIGEHIAELIIENRESKIKVKPGFDGEYGVAIDKEKKTFY